VVVCDVCIACHPLGEGNKVVWWRLLDTQVCCALGVMLICVVHVEGGGRVVPPFPVPSPCSGVGMVLGTGASFGEGFMSVTEAGKIAGTRSGRFCGTNCGELHPPTQASQSRAQVSGFLGGGCGGPIPKGLLLVSNR